MAKDSLIQWDDDSENPVMGCDGCELWDDKSKVCYAGKLHEFRKGRPGYARDFSIPEKFPGRMMKAARRSDLTGCSRPTKPWLNGMPRLIFVSDMGDALSKNISFGYLEAEIIAAAESPEGQRHVWLWLTKRPNRMAEFADWLFERGVKWPRNLWAGTSVTSNASTARLDSLPKVGDETTTRFVSVEPQWEAIDLSPWLPDLDWVIAGGESKQPQFKKKQDGDSKPNQEKPKVKPAPYDLAWAREFRDQCAGAGVSFFLKQLGSAPKENGVDIKLKDHHGGDWDEWPADLRVRQLPKP